MPKIGDIAPDFELEDDEGKRVKLSDFRGQNVVLYFYPQDFTSGCELQACAFRDTYSDFKAKNAIVLGVSPDDAESHRKFREAHNLPFKLLVDKDLRVSKAWNSAAERTSPDGGTALRIQRGQYVIEETGKIIDAQTPVKATESKKLALDALREA